MALVQAASANCPMSSQPLVLIVEDHAEAAQSLAALLPAERLACQVYSSAEAFLEAAPLEAADCLLLDLGLPGISGLALQERLQARGVELPVILLMGAATVADTIRAFENGACRVFPKPLEPLVLVEAVQTAVARHRARLERRVAFDHRLQALTAREREVLRLLLHDRPTKQIARVLGISPSTVEKHRAKILTKCGVNSVVGLAQLGWTPEPEGPAAFSSAARLTLGTL